MNTYQFQIQYTSGNWETLTRSDEPTDTEIRMTLRGLKESHSDKKVRCINSDGQLIDILA